MKTISFCLTISLCLLCASASPKFLFLPNPVNHGTKSDSSFSNQDAVECVESEVEIETTVAKADSAIPIKKNYFAIEQSIDAADFMQVGVVITHGSSSDMHDYSVSDENACKTVFYYRISNIEIEDTGQVMHIRWMKIDDDKLDGIIAFPNRSGTDLSIRLEKNMPYKLTIYTPDERRLVEQVYSDEKGIVKPRISYMPDGVYLINIDSGTSIFSFLYLKR